METRTATTENDMLFTRLAATWWDAAGPFRLLHGLNRFRVPYLRDHICHHFDRDPAAPRPLEGLRVLDVGCGGGLLCEALDDLGASVVGIDVVGHNIEVARRHAQQTEHGIDYRHAGPEDLAHDHEDYDVVCCLEVVEHVAALGPFMEALCPLVKPGGLMALSTINRTVKSLLFAKIGAEYVLRLLPAGTHRWAKFVTPQALEEALARHNFTVTARTGIKVNPFTGVFRFTPGLAVNYMLLAHKSYPHP